MKVLITLFTTTLLTIVLTIQVNAQAVPPTEILYEPTFQTQDGKMFVSIKWKTEVRATKSKFRASYVDPNSGLNIVIDENNQSVTVDPITETNEGVVTTVGKIFTAKIPFGIGQKLTEAAPNFRFDVIPHAVTAPPAATKPTSIWINMDSIRAYFKAKTDAAQMSTLAEQRKVEIDNIKTTVESQKGEIATLKASEAKLTTDLGRIVTARKPVLKSLEVTEVTHKSATVEVKSESDLPVQIRAIAFLGTDTKVRTPINNVQTETKYVSPNTKSTFRITNIPQGQNFFIVVQEVFDAPPDPVRTPVEEIISTDESGKKLITQNLGANIDPKITFLTTPKIIKNEKIAVKLDIANAKNYQVKIEVKDDRGAFSPIYTSELKDATNGNTDVEIPIKVFKLIQEKEYHLTAVAYSKFKDVEPSASDTSLSFFGLRDKLFNDFAIGVNKDGLELKIVGVQEPTAKFTLSVDVDGSEKVKSIDCPLSANGTDRSCQLDFAGVVGLVRSLNIISSSKAKSVTFKANANTGDGSEREQHQPLTFLVDPASTAADSKWAKTKEFSKKLLGNDSANDSSSIKVKDIIGNGVAGLISLIAGALF